MHLARTLLLLAAVSCLASGAQAASGVNLRWNQCLGDGGVVNRPFACDTNSGSETLVCSFEVAADVPQASGLEIVIDLVTNGASLPAWWAFKNAGACRQSALAISTEFPQAAVNCTDWASGAAIAVIGAYDIGVHGPNTARIIAATVVPDYALAALSAGTEYFSAKFTISHTQTVGTGACVGCLGPACIVFSSERVTTPVAINNRVLTGPTDALNSYYATWEGGGVFPGPGVDKSCPFPIPTRHTSWGAVRALYR